MLPAVIATVLYGYSLFIMEKGKPWGWMYLTLLPMGIVIVVAFVQYIPHSFLVTLVSLAANLTWVGYRYLILRRVHKTQDMAD